MPRIIKADCPECGLAESLTIAFGEPYRDFGDGYSEDDFRVRIEQQICNCDLEDDERVTETIEQWNRDCYPYQIKGEWYR